MKLTKIALTLSIAAFLPTLAFAGTNEIANSFDRDLNREATVTQVTSASVADPLVNAINIAFYGNNDSVLVSFERDLNHESTVTDNSQIESISDPLEEAFNKVVNNSSTVLASFERNLNHEPTKPQEATMIAGAANPLSSAFKVVL